MADKVSMKNIVAVLILAGVAGGGAQAAQVTANTNATVIAPISITQTTALNFGTVAGDVSGGTVETLTLDLANGVLPTGNAYYGGGGQTGVLTVTGDGGRSYSVTVDSVTPLSDGLNTMDVAIHTSHTLGTADSAGGATSITGTGTISGTTPATGSDTILVGGVLTINPGQAAGVYSGTYAVTVNY